MMTGGDTAAVAASGDPVPQPPLSISVRAALRTPLLRLGLLLPTVAFFGFLFFWPIATMLARGVYSPEVRTGLPHAAAAIRTWSGDGLPDEAVFAALAKDLRRPHAQRAIAEAARRLNYEIPGYRTLLFKTAAALRDRGGPVAESDFVAIDGRWGELSYWAALRRAAPALTASYLLASVDLQERDDGTIGPVPRNRAIFLDVLARTLWISGVVTAICLALAFPVAFHIADAAPRYRSFLLFLVLLPFWTSLLARTTAWVVLLQDKGIVNELLMWLRLIDQPLPLIFNRTGVYIALVHVMLPFVILPLYSVMRGISADYMRAAHGLGASLPRAFFKVYLPLVWPGALSGSLLCFVTCAGYYVTPLLIGGSHDQMISYFIAFYTNKTVNWGLASALAILLTICVLALLGLYGLSGRNRPTLTR